MNDRITALRHVIDMAQDFTDDKVGITDMLASSS